MNKLGKVIVEVNQSMSAKGETNTNNYSWRRNKAERRKLVKAYLARQSAQRLLSSAQTKDTPARGASAKGVVKSELVSREGQHIKEDIATIGNWMIEAAKVMIRRNCKKERKGKRTYETLWDEDLSHYIGATPTLKVRPFKSWIKKFNSDRERNSQLEVYVEEVLCSCDYSPHYTYDIFEKIKYAVRSYRNSSF